jgi:hypothetical protein
MYNIDSIEEYPNINLSQNDLQELLELTEVVEEYFWEKRNLIVVRDGHNKEGTRIHFIKGYAASSISIMLLIDNTFVIMGEDV